MAVYRIFDRDDRDSGGTVELEQRIFNPLDPEQVSELFNDWPYAAVDWEVVR